MSIAKKSCIKSIMVRVKGSVKERGRERETETDERQERRPQAILHEGLQKQC